MTYLNLHNEGNIIDEETKKKLWVPPLIFQNSAANKILRNDEKTTMNIIKEGKPKLNSQMDLDEAYIFKGNENILQYKREYQMEMQCEYNLRMYPFDYQVCAIDVYVPIIKQEFMNVFAKSAKNWGNSQLPQFVITDIDIRGFQNDSLVKCLISMQRMPFYHIATTYMPTVCILFMTLITLFIDKSHFEATIMVALTNMLVMFFLYNSVSISMPSTAYLKLLDFWLIFGLVIPFLVFTVIMAWEIMDQRLIKVLKSPY